MAHEGAFSGFSRLFFRCGTGRFRRMLSSLRCASTPRCSRFVFFPFWVIPSSCNGGWSERFRCLLSVLGLHFGISFYFLTFFSVQVNSGKLDIKKKSQVTFFSLFIPSILVPWGWYHLMSRKSFASSSRSTASPRRQVKLAMVGPAGKVCGKEFSGIDWCLNTSIFFGWSRGDLLSWVHRFSTLRLNPEQVDRSTFQVTCVRTF